MLNYISPLGRQLLIFELSAILVKKDKVNESIHSSLN